jgi:multidrug efflux pump subunit AcrA (membrane-fusion protein)
MRAGADEREEEMTADMDKLTDENDYLKSELARLRIQYDRAKRTAQQDRRRAVRRIDRTAQGPSARRHSIPSTISSARIRRCPTR